MYQLTFLGTSAGIPTRQRNVSALAVKCVNPYLRGDKQSSNKHRPWLLIDCGEATQHQLLKTKLSPHQLHTICITHVHGDHCYGLPGLLASLSMSGRRRPLVIIAPKAIATLLDSVRLTTELYLTYPIRFIAIEDVLADPCATASTTLAAWVDNSDEMAAVDKQLTLSAGEVRLSFTPSHQLSIAIVPLSHRVASHAFVLTQSLSAQTLNVEKLRADGIAAGKQWGLLQRGHDVVTTEGRQLRAEDYLQSRSDDTTIIIAGDNDNPALLTPYMDQATVLVHEATYTDALLAKILARQQADAGAGAVNPMHSSAGQVARFAQQVQLPNLILTHFSARFQSFEDATATTPNMADIRSEVEQYYQGNCWLAADFKQFAVDKTVKLQQ